MLSLKILFRFGVVVCLGLLLSAGTVQAACIHFDDVTTGGGTMSYSTAGGPLVGTDLHLDEVEGCGTPANSGVTLTLVGGNLDFTTGNLTSYNAGLGIWTFAGGGSFDIWALEAYYDTTPGDPTTRTWVIGSSGNTTEINLATGSFVGNQAAWHQQAPNIITFSGGGKDTKNTDLVDFYGLQFVVPPYQYEFAQTEITAQLGSGVPAGDGTFSAAVSETDVVNYPVPEPSSVAVWLGIAGVLGIGAGFRRRKQVANKA